MNTVYSKGYGETGASMERRALKGFRPNSGSPSEDINLNNATLRQRARMLYMGSPIASSAINTNRTKVVGTGLSLKSTIDTEILGIDQDTAIKWQNKTQAEFALWASKKQNCDALGINDFENLQQLVLKSWLMSGDVFALIKHEKPTKMNPYGLRLHVIEADRISTPDNFGASFSTEGTVPEGKPGAGHKVFDGVEVDAGGKIVAYYICNTYPQANLWEKREWTRVEAYGIRTGMPNILQIMDTERPDQYRGVPYLAPVIEPLVQLRRYTDSELMAALVQSFFTAWISTESDTAEIPFNEVGDSFSETGDYDANPNEYEMGPATVIHLGPKEKVNFGNPNIPTAGFETFMRTICRHIGAGLEIPYDVLVKEFNASYSASRGALMEAWDTFKMRRKWFAADFCQPIYELWLTEAVARGRIKAPGFFDDPLIRDAWCKAQWIGPVQGQLDPLKEAKASVMLTNCGIKTHEQITREISGGDWESNVKQLAHENELLTAAGSPYHPDMDDDDDGEGRADDAQQNPGTSGFHVDEDETNESNKF